MASEPGAVNEGSILKGEEGRNVGNAGLASATEDGVRERNGVSGARCSVAVRGRDQKERLRASGDAIAAAGAMSTALALPLSSAGVLKPSVENRASPTDIRRVRFSWN